MKIISKFTKVVPILLLLIVTSCNSDDDGAVVPPSIVLSIVETAQDTSSLSSLVAALVKADLVTILEGNGPFTVLAPDNDAFGRALTALGFASLDEIDTPAEIAILRNILLNHVIAGSFTSSQLSTGYVNTSATNADGDNISLYIEVEGGDVSFNGMSDVTAADIIASNGIVHLVDEVITLPTIVDFAASNAALSILVDAVGYADGQDPSPGIGAILSGTTNYTVFAPTNDAFVALLAELNVSALTDIPAATVEDVLFMHVVTGNVRSTDLTSGPVTTAYGEDVTIDATSFTITDPNARVSNIVTTLVDIQAINGVVHVIDKVILPVQ